MTRGDPFDAMRCRLAAVRPTLSWRRDDPTWVDQARAALISVVGVVREPWPAASFDMGEGVQEKGFRRVRVEFPSHRGWDGRGWLLIPDGLIDPAPAVVCLPGHGWGADAIVGLIEEPYQADFALQCVREGWVTLAVEQVSFGSNRSEREPERQASCVMDSMAALLLGETVTGWRVRDAMAGYRALAVLPQVDARRIGAMGISGGGLTALWSAAIEPGFLAAGVSGYFCPMAESILKVDHCPDNYVPGLGLLMDVPDLAGLIAPRWLAVESGTQDPLFSAAGFGAACDLARSIYSPHPERLACDLFEGDHVFHGVVLLEHFRKAFGVKSLGK